MGSDPAPFMANLFLFYYENKYLMHLKKINIPRARRFSNIFRFIDDLNAINDGEEFSRTYHEIYPPELDLKKENCVNTSASFLDLDINIQHREFRLSLYDKRDTFPFDIVRMPYLDSNMPSRIFYSTLNAEILRIARCTTEREAFVKSANKLCTRMLKQGANYNRTIHSLTKIYGKHFESFVFFFPTSDEMIAELIRDATHN